ncbi:MAG: hypothetical protein ACRDMJ_09990 [Solirubrobacteraceae bacterium]
MGRFGVSLLSAAVVVAVAIVFLGGHARHHVMPPSGSLGSGPLLARPLHLRSLGPGGRCPVSSGYTVSNPYFAGTALGHGPVRVLLADRGDVLHGRVDLGGATRGSLHAIQTLWFAMPGYHGPFVVRGARLGRPGRIEVQAGEDGQAPGSGPLIVAAGPTANTFPDGYRTVPGSTWIRSPGCYAWQIDGHGFSETIVFAVLASTLGQHGARGGWRTVAQRATVRLPQGTATRSFTAHAVAAHPYDVSVTAPRGAMIQINAVADGQTLSILSSLQDQGCVARTRAVVCIMHFAEGGAPHGTVRFVVRKTSNAAATVNVSVRFLG